MGVIEGAPSHIQESRIVSAQELLGKGKDKIKMVYTVPPHPIQEEHAWQWLWSVCAVVPVSFLLCLYEAAV